MAAEADSPAPRIPRLAGWFGRLCANRRFHAIASRMPIGRGIVRRDGAAIFDLLQGFVASQVLTALVELEVLRALLPGPRSPEHLSLAAGLAPDRMAILCQAGAAVGVLTKRRDGRFGLSRRGAAILGVPGLQDMIRHNRAFYADMADPVALLKGATDTRLARFWPYVLGSSDIPADEAERYSALMSESQGLVAEDTLKLIPLSGITRLTDVGGGSGAFLQAALTRYPGLTAQLLDLPRVLPAAEARLAGAGLADRVLLCPGSFRDGPLPGGADAISLIRVLYDHDDATVADLLAKAHAALPPGGALIVSEPMAGGQVPDRAGDVYFAFYTMAMGTGRARSADRIADMCRRAGFVDLRIPAAPRPYVTSALICRKPGGSEFPC